MALQPSDRPASSTQVIRFTGGVQQGVAQAVYPKANCEYSLDVPPLAPPDTYCLRLLLADATDLADQLRRFPEFVFDDTQPAGASPHAPTFFATPMLNATDANISQRAWFKNTYVTIQPLDTFSKGLLALVPPTLTEVCLDGVNSGLGTNTGLPVICIALDIPNVPEEGAINLDILIEIRHSASR
jgi:hypothetical protein